MEGEIPMAKFLVATMPVPGHIAPIAPVVRQLVQNGNEVVWYGSTFFKDKIESTGARFYPVKSTLDYGDSDYNRHFPGRAGLKGLNQIKFDFKHAFIDPIEGYMKDLKEILATFHADVLMGDPAVVAILMLGEQRKLPWVVFNISVLGIPSVDLAPFGLGILPDYSALGKLRNRVLEWVGTKLVFSDVQKHYDQAAARNGWPSLIFRPSVSPYLYLQPSVEAFEYPRTDLPPQVHFIGPVLPEASKSFTPPAWWDEVTQAKKPVILVTQGTIATDTEQLISPTLAALGDEDVIVIATTGGKTAAEANLTVPRNAHVEPFIPFTALMPHVSAMITNGGYGGVTIALAHGVPVISGGNTEDKSEVGNRITYTGVGINLKTPTPTPAQIKDAVKKILSDASYRRKAQALQAEFAKHNAPNEATKLLETLAATRNPVYGSLPASTISAGWKQLPIVQTT
jgi:UDP:flavonoid glycosyltransferase YjiC (YdhE family)